MKKTPQRQRRYEFELKWKKLKGLAIIRDHGLCVVCGRPAVTVNHILSRGAHPSLMLSLKNTACLCKAHDDEFTNTKEFAKMLLHILMKSPYSYSYQEQEFQEILNA